jgi:type VI secretion system secreted protein VgrG
VFGDDQTVFPKLAPVAYQQDSGLVADTPMIKRFACAWKPAPAASPAATTTSRNR